MALDEKVRLLLLPLGYLPLRPSPPPAPPGRGGKPAAPAPPPAGNRAVADEVADHGWKKLDKIEKDYNSQITAWKGAFGQVISAYAVAVNRRDLVLSEAERERQADAALASFILGLMTSGAMRFLGAWMQYTVVPNIKVSRLTGSWDFTKAGPGIVGRLTIAPQPVEAFTKLQASAFGGIAQDIGNRVISQAWSFPKPKPVAYKLDSWSGVDKLRSDFNVFVDASAKPVLEQFQAVKDWMEDEPEFGAAWAAHAGGDVERARVAVRGRLKELRDKWAGEWELFGTDPGKPEWAALADNYERSLWASHLLEVLGPALAKANKDRDVNEYISESVAHHTPDDPEFGRKNRGMWVGPKLIEMAIVRRLHELNVVLADSSREFTAQMIRISEGAPQPKVKVHGAVDFEDEVNGLMGWAEGFLKSAPDMTARRFFSSGSKRPLPAI